ncbi:MAG: SIMPL domain-containing protein [Candidatus Bathyarchaeota archaeon]|nr:SIMPL domain-containing protein [Candidatus Bathyarchaeum sp.]
MKVKKQVLIGALVMLTFLVTAVAYASTGAELTSDINELQTHTISISGSGSASMQADTASIILGVQTEDKEASEAIVQNAEMMTNVIEAMKALGINEDAMETVSYNVYPVYSRDDYSLIVGYRVENLISIETTDISSVGELIDAAAENGANRIQQVSFGVSEEKQEQLRTQAYLSALDDAEAKANLIAEKLGLSLTGIIHVNEGTYQTYQPYSLKVGLTSSENATPILEGEQSVSVTVNIIYAFSQ